MLTISSSVHDVRAGSDTPLAPVLFGASGYMTKPTAEQKSLESVRVFLAALVIGKGDYPRGYPPWERFAYFSAGKSKCRAA